MPDKPGTVYPATKCGPDPSIGRTSRRGACVSGHRRTGRALSSSLKTTPMLFPLLAAVPHTERRGAVVKASTDYLSASAATASGFARSHGPLRSPTRCGRWTRARLPPGTDATGADFKSISDLLTHSEPRTTVRYIRNTSKKMRTLAKARAQTRDGVAMPERCRNGPSERCQNDPVIDQRVRWSGQQDLNLRPGVPKTPALPGCAMPRRCRRASIHGSVWASKPQLRPQAGRN